MSEPDRFTAQILESGSRGYSALAADALAESRPDLAGTGEGRAAWRAHLAQRLSELQTAVGFGRPGLFLERVRWSRRAHLVRDVSEADLEAALRCLREVLDSELPSASRTRPLELIDLALSDFSHPVEADTGALDPADPVDRTALRYLLDVLEGRPREAVEGLVAARDELGLDLRDCVVRVLLPAQREIGRLWHRGDSDVAEEHLVTSTTKRALSVLAHTTPPVPSNGKVLLCAAVAGDTHDIGTQALALLLETRGWRCVDLGADMPVEDLVAARAAFEPDVIVLAATLAEHLAALETSIRALRRVAGDALRIHVGGSAALEAPDLPRSWGADAVLNDLDDALAQLGGD